MSKQGKIWCVTARQMGSDRPSVTGEVCALDAVVHSAIGKWPPPHGTMVELHFQDMTVKQWESLPEFEA